MDKQVKLAKISKILIITSIATGVTLSGAYLIYKRNKDNKQYKGNSQSNFSITIHLTKDQVNKGKLDKEEIIDEEDDLSEIQDFDEYVSSLPSSEERNFFLDLFDKFMSLFTKKEDLLDDTIIITKPNEALSFLDDTVEIDENNDTIIITKPNESSTTSTASASASVSTTSASTSTSSIDSPRNKENVKILNEVIEQTINLVNSNNDLESSSTMSMNLNSSTPTLTKHLSLKNKKSFERKNIIGNRVYSSDTKNTTTTTTTTTTTNNNNYNNYNYNNYNNNYNSNSTMEGAFSTESSTSTLIVRHDEHETTSAAASTALEELQNNSSDNSLTVKGMMPEGVDISSIIRGGHYGRGDDDEVEEENAKYTKDSLSLNSRRRRGRKETITAFDYNRKENENENDELKDTTLDNESIGSIGPSTPKMSFANNYSFTPLYTMENTNTNNNNGTPNINIDKEGENYGMKLGEEEVNDDNESINPLSIDINQLLATQNFEFSSDDEEEEGGGRGSMMMSTADAIDIVRSTNNGGRTLHRASSISSTSTFQSAKSTWTTDGRSILEENNGGNGGNNTTHLSINKDPVVHDENWEVNSACSSTSGFYSAQEEFFDINME